MQRYTPFAASLTAAVAELTCDHAKDYYCPCEDIHICYPIMGFVTSGHDERLRFSVR